MSRPGCAPTLMHAKRHTRTARARGEVCLTSANNNDVGSRNKLKGAPISASFPASITATRSQSMIVCRRWAMVNTWQQESQITAKAIVETHDTIWCNQFTPCSRQTRDEWYAGSRCQCHCRRWLSPHPESALCCSCSVAVVSMPPGPQCYIPPLLSLQPQTLEWPARGRLAAARLR